MKLKLHWSEQYNVIRRFPTFELDSQKFPELELEMLQVYNAGSLGERARALGDLENKMQDTHPTDRGETIFSLVGPYQNGDFTTEFLATDDHGSLVLTEEK